MVSVASDDVARTAAAGQRTVYVRHPGDVIRVALGAVLVAVCSVIAAAEPVSGVEAGLFHVVNSLPSWLYGPLWLVMQLGSLGAVFGVAALAALLRRFRLAVELLAAGLVAYYSALGLKDLVGRGRPPALLSDVIVARRGGAWAGVSVGARGGLVRAHGHRGAVLGPALASGDLGAPADRRLGPDVRRCPLPS